MTMYTIQFLNTTDTDYCFFVYQKYPNSSGLQSVAWKVKKLPKQWESRDAVQWTMEYGLATTFQLGDVFNTKQFKDVQLSSFWQLAPDSNGDTSLQPMTAPPGKKVPDEVMLTNSMGKNETAGFTLSDNLISVKTFNEGESAQFVVNKTYYVGLFRDIQVGQLLSSDIINNSVAVEFPDDFTVATVTAFNDGGTYKLTKPTYSKY